MALPIIVPTSTATAAPVFTQGSSAQLYPNKPLRFVSSADPERYLSTDTREPTDRELLLMRWHQIAWSRWVLRPDGRNSDFQCHPKRHNEESMDGGGNLLSSCEWLLRERLSRTWHRLNKARRADVHRLVHRFKPAEPVVKVSAKAADAATWILFGMCWCGSSHPRALFEQALHPPTAVVHWISQFHIEHQSERSGEIEERFVRYLAVTKGRCDLLVQRMIAKTGCVALMPEICSF